MGEIKYMPAGDRALVVEFGNQIDPALNDKVHALAAKIAEIRIPGVQEMVPTFRSLMIYYDPAITSFENVRKQTAELTGQETDFKNSVLLWRKIRIGSGRYGKTYRTGS